MRTQSFVVRVDFVYDDDIEENEGVGPLTEFEAVKTWIEESVHQGSYTIVAITDTPYVEE